MKLSREILGQLSTYFIGKLGVKPHRTGWLRQGLCPSCGKDRKFGVNVSLNRTNCFSCGFHETPMNLLIHLESLSTYNEAFVFLGAFDPTKVIDTPLNYIKEKTGSLPDGYRLITIGDSVTGELARKYMSKRGFDLDFLTMKGIGYCVEGPYYGRIIIPFYEEGRLIYFNARQFLNLADKHKNPSMDEFGIGKSLLMYNADCLKVYDKSYLMESAMNCLTWGDDAFGIGGKTISQYQLTRILLRKPKRLVIVLDPDAYFEAIKLGLLLSKYLKIKVLKLPTGKDVNDLGRKPVRRIELDTPWQSYQDLYRIFITLPKPVYTL